MPKKILGIDISGFKPAPPPPYLTKKGYVVGMVGSMGAFCLFLIAVGFKDRINDNYVYIYPALMFAMIFFTGYLVTGKIKNSLYFLFGTVLAISLSIVLRIFLSRLIGSYL